MTTLALASLLLAALCIYALTFIGMDAIERAGPVREPVTSHLVAAIVALIALAGLSKLVGVIA